MTTTARGGALNHTAPAPKNPDARDDGYAGSLANPRRIRVDADGRPIYPQTSASRD
jgi:hypothetical protein